MRGSQNTELTVIVKGVSVCLSVPAPSSIVTEAGKRVISRGCSSVDIPCMVNALVWMGSQWEARKPENKGGRDVEAASVCLYPG